MILFATNHDLAGFIPVFPANGITIAVYVVGLHLTIEMVMNEFTVKYTIFHGALALLRAIFIKGDDFPVLLPIPVFCLIHQPAVRVMRNRFPVKRFFRIWLKSYPSFID